jgi:hypothetical protein
MHLPVAKLFQFFKHSHVSIDNVRLDDLASATRPTKLVGSLNSQQ